MSYHIHISCSRSHIVELYLFLFPILASWYQTLDRICQKIFRDPLLPCAIIIGQSGVIGRISIITNCDVFMAVSELRLLLQHSHNTISAAGPSQQLTWIFYQALPTSTPSRVSQHHETKYSRHISPYHLCSCMQALSILSYSK